jgi:hypothetical protein
MRQSAEHVATALQTYSTGRFVEMFEIHYGQKPVFIRGYAGNALSLGEPLRSLVARGGRDMHLSAGRRAWRAGVSEYPTCHAVVVGEQPHEGCDVCSLLAALDEITAVDGEGRPLHDQAEMYQIADDALSSATNQPEHTPGEHGKAGRP